MQDDNDKMKEVMQFLKEVGGPNTTSPGNEDAHYFGQIEPIDFVEDQQLGYHEGNIIKYISRWQYKGGVLDLFKAGWFLMRLIQFEQRRLLAIEATEREETNAKKPGRK